MVNDVKITTNFNVLDWLAPYTCRGCGVKGGLLCDRCKNYNRKKILRLCACCKNDLAQCKCAYPVAVVAYREGVLVRLVEDYKYQSIRATAPVLADLMADAAMGMPSLEDVREVVIVPLPTIGRHVRERGFDHTRLLAKKLRKELARRLTPKISVERLLMRQNNTVQVGASGEERQSQAAAAYAISPKFNEEQDLSMKTYLLIDDVWTTGSSMKAAMAVLEKAGVKKMCGAVILMPREAEEDAGSIPPTPKTRPQG